MTKSQKKSKLVKEFKKEKDAKLVKKFNELVESKVNENLNEDVELVLLKKKDPAVLLGNVTFKGTTYTIYLSYRYNDIVQHVSQPKKEDELFNIPHYLVVMKDSKLYIGEDISEIIEFAKGTFKDEEVTKRFTTLRDSVAVTGMFDSLGTMAGGK